MKHQRHYVRVVKEIDSKSIGLCPQGFKSPWCRYFCVCFLRRGLCLRVNLWSVDVLLKPRYAPIFISARIHYFCCAHTSLELSRDLRRMFALTLDSSPCSFASCKLHRVLQELPGKLHYCVPVTHKMCGRSELNVYLSRSAYAIALIGVTGK